MVNTPLNDSDTFSVLAWFINVMVLYYSTNLEPQTLHNASMHQPVINCCLIRLFNLQIHDACARIRVFTSISISKNCDAPRVYLELKLLHQGN